MRLSTTVRYAARTLAQIATVSSERPVSVREIAERQRISPKYLEQILKALKGAGFVRALRGKRGGYVLARPPESITLRALYESLEGPLAPVECVDCAESCPLYAACPTRDTWVELKSAIGGVLERTTVRDLAERLQPTASELVYHI